MQCDFIKQIYYYIIITNGAHIVTIQLQFDAPDHIVIVLKLCFCDAAAQNLAFIRHYWLIKRHFFVFIRSDFNGRRVSRRRERRDHSFLCTHSTRWFYRLQKVAFKSVYV